MKKGNPRFHLLRRSTDTNKNGISNVAMETEKVSISDMLKNLFELSEEQWSLYAFSREPIKGKLTISERIHIGIQAAICGKTAARELIANTDSQSPLMCAKKLGISIEHLPIPSDGSRVLFAQFCPPDKIRIYDNCLDKANLFLPLDEKFKLMYREDISNLLLAHELFHVVEERNKQTIFTQQEKIQLWSIGPIRYKSSISCLSEIAAMSFAKEMCELSYSPYLLDVFLVYGYNPSAATHLYNGIMRISHEITMNDYSEITISE